VAGKCFALCGDTPHRTLRGCRGPDIKGRNGRGPGHQTADGHGQPAATTVTVSGVHVRADNTLDIDLSNASGQKIYAYATVRNVQYDASGRTLKVVLAETESTEATRGVFMLPEFVPVGAGDHRTISVAQPQRISDAATVEVRLAWSDKPFQVDNSASAPPVAAQLVAWQAGTATGSATL
jgi:hypothetical protein